MGSSQHCDICAQLPFKIVSIFLDQQRFATAFIMSPRKHNSIFCDSLHQILTIFLLTFLIHPRSAHSERDFNIYAAPDPPSNFSEPATCGTTQKAADLPTVHYAISQLPLNESCGNHILGGCTLQVRVRNYTDAWAPTGARLYICSHMNSTMPCEKAATKGFRVLADWDCGLQIRDEIAGKDAGRDKVGDGSGNSPSPDVARGVNGVAWLDQTGTGGPWVYIENDHHVEYHHSDWHSD